MNTNTALGAALANALAKDELVLATHSDQTVQIVTGEKQDECAGCNPDCPGNCHSADVGLVTEMDTVAVTEPMNMVVIPITPTHEEAVAQGKAEAAYPDPEKVLTQVEDRTVRPKKKPMTQQKQPVQEKPKGKMALFSLSNDRPASSLLKNVFDSTKIEGVDSVDHINIHNDAKTKLGRFLDMNSNTPFVHPEAGTFHSVGGLWHYVQTVPLVEEYRILTGAQLRRKVSLLRDEARNNQDNPNVPRHRTIKGFRTIIADAMWYKVTQNEEIVTLMAESTLPFEHYFTQGELNIRQYPSEGYWIVAAYEEIRRVIKLRLSTGDVSVQPDFTKIEMMPNPRNIVEKPRYDNRRNHQNNQAPSPYGSRKEGSYFNRG